MSHFLYPSFFMKNGIVATAIALMVAGQATPAFAAFAEDFERMRGKSAERPVTNADERTLDTDDEEMILTRADFVGGVVEALYDEEDIETCFWDITSPLPPRFTLVFRDVHVDHPASKHLCVAMRDGLIRGYADGSFKPDAKITMAEAGKIFSRVFVLAPFAEYDFRSPWYRHHLIALSDRNVIPMNIVSLTQYITAADAAEMLERLMEEDTSKPGTSYEELTGETLPQKQRSVPVKSSSSSSSAQSSAPAKDEEDKDAMTEERMEK